MKELSSILDQSRNFLGDVLPGIKSVIMTYYRKEFDVEFKSDNSPVTIADREAEEFIRQKIMKKFPDHGIIGEEAGDVLPEAEFKWILDPIDGTKSFVAGVPLFGSLIALTLNGKPILGCIYLPVTDDVIIGDNTVTTINGKTVRMKKDVALGDSVILTTDYKDFSRYKNRDGFDRLTAGCRISRTWGDCFGYYLLAAGRAHVMVDPAMSVWDKMALIPVIQGAGGTITDFYGNDPEKGDSIVASVSGLHPKVIELLNSLNINRTTD